MNRGAETGPLFGKNIILFSFVDLEENGVFLFWYRSNLQRSLGLRAEEPTAAERSLRLCCDVIRNTLKVFRDHIAVALFQ